MSEDNKSLFAKELSKLKENVLRAANERERLPQPLFWSLFNSRLESLRSQKRKKRALEEVFNGTSE